MAFNPLYGGVALDFMPHEDRMSHATKKRLSPFTLTNTPYARNCYCSLAQVQILRADETKLKGYTVDNLLKMLHETEGGIPAPEAEEEVDI